MIIGMLSNAPSQVAQKVHPCPVDSSHGLDCDYYLFLFLFYYYFYYILFYSLLLLFISIYLFLFLMVYIYGRPIVLSVYTVYWCTCCEVNYKLHHHAISHHICTLYTVNPLDSKGNYSATSNNTKLVHWPMMGGLLHLVQ